MHELKQKVALIATIGTYSDAQGATYLRLTVSGPEKRRGLVPRRVALPLQTGVVGVRVRIRRQLIRKRWPCPAAMEWVLSPSVGGIGAVADRFDRAFRALPNTV